MNQLWTTNIAYDIFVRDKRNTMTCKLLAKKVRSFESLLHCSSRTRKNTDYPFSPSSIFISFPIPRRVQIRSRGSARFWPNDPLWAIKAPRRPLEDKRNETTRGPETKSSSTRLINYPVARAPGVIRRSARRYPLLRPPWTSYRGPPRIPPPAYHPLFNREPSLSIPFDSKYCKSSN